MILSWERSEGKSKPLPLPPGEEEEISGKASWEEDSGGQGRSLSGCSSAEGRVGHLCALGQPADGEASARKSTFWLQRDETGVSEGIGLKKKWVGGGMEIIEEGGEG